MVVRDALAAVLIVVGIGAVSWGAGLVTPAAGFVAFGLQLVLLGLALGVGEVRGRAEQALEAAQEEPESVPIRLYREGPPEVVPENPPLPARPTPTTPTNGPAVIPIGSYLGVREPRESEAP